MQAHMHELPVAAMLFGATAWSIATAGAALGAPAAYAFFAPPQSLQLGSYQAQPRFYVTPSIHQSVMNKLTREQNGDDAYAQGSGARSTEDESQVPTSMLWPAYKFLPQISHAFTA